MTALVDTERLTDLDAPYALPEAAVAAYRAQGFVRLSAVLSPATLTAFGEEITRQTIALNNETRPLEDRSTYNRAFLQVMNLWRVNDAVRRFVFSRRLAQIAAALLEVRGVRLYHDQSLYKEPSGGFTPAHADQYYWPMSSDRTVTAWIPLQAVPAAMGPLALYAGSHRTAFGRDLAISDESEAMITAAMELKGFALDEQPFALGDVSFHSGWTFHRAGPNRTAQPRSVMTMIYMDADMRLAAPANHVQAEGAERWCPGAIVGEMIDTPLNPVLWP